MTTLFTLPKCIATPGAKLTFTQTGTTTPQSTYTDEALTVASSNPVVADSSGVFAPIYLDPRLPSYRVKLTTSADVLVYQVDNVPSNQGAVTALRVESTVPEIILYDTDGTSGSRKYRIRAAGSAFEFASLNDAESVADTFFSYGGTAPSFTGTLSGMTATITGTFYYRRTGKHVTIWCETQVQGTSNASSMSLSGLPAAIQPTTAKLAPCSGLIDNGATYAGSGNVSSSSITFALYGVTGTKINNSTAFLNSGTKGIDTGWSISYPVS